MLYGVPLLGVRPLCLHILLHTLPLVSSIASLPAAQEVIKFRVSQAFVRKTSHVYKSQKGRFVVGDKYLYIEHFFLFHSWSGLVERKEITESFWLTAKCCISRYVQLLSILLDFSLNLKTICRIRVQQWAYVVQCSNLDHLLPFDKLGQCRNLDWQRKYPTSLPILFFFDEREAVV